MLYANALCRPLPPSSPFLARENRDAYGLDGDLRDFIEFRLDRVNPYEHSLEYRHWQEKASGLHDRLDGMLGADGRELLQEFSDALGAAYYLEMMLQAERAFLDGMRLVLRAMRE